jgi:hypothetical protein
MDFYLKNQMPIEHKPNLLCVASIAFGYVLAI